MALSWPRLSRLLHPSIPFTTPYGPIPQVRFEKYVLPNGLQVIFTRTTPRRLSGQRLVPRGSRTSGRAAPASPTSSSTMMFQGLQALGPSTTLHLCQELEALNGSTNQDRTIIGTTVPQPTWSWPSGWNRTVMGFCSGDDSGEARQPAERWSRTSAARAMRTGLRAGLRDASWPPYTRPTIPIVGRRSARDRPEQGVRRRRHRPFASAATDHPAIASCASPDSIGTAGGG